MALVQLLKPGDYDEMALKRTSGLIDTSKQTKFGQKLSIGSNRKLHHANMIYGNYKDIHLCRKPFKPPVLGCFIKNHELRKK